MKKNNLESNLKKYLFYEYFFKELKERSVLLEGFLVGSTIHLGQNLVENPSLIYFLTENYNFSEKIDLLTNYITNPLFMIPYLVPVLVQSSVRAYMKKNNIGKILKEKAFDVSSDPNIYLDKTGKVLLLGWKEFNKYGINDFKNLSISDFLSEETTKNIFERIKSKSEKGFEGFSTLDNKKYEISITEIKEQYLKKPIYFLRFSSLN